VQLEQPALHHPFGGVPEGHEGPSPARHVDRGALMPRELASNSVTGQPAAAHSAAQPQPMSPAPITAIFCGSGVKRSRLPATSASASRASPSGTPARRQRAHATHLDLCGDLHAGAIGLHPGVAPVLAVGQVHDDALLLERQRVGTEQQGDRQHVVHDAPIQPSACLWNSM